MSGFCAHDCALKHNHVYEPPTMGPPRGHYEALYGNVRGLLFTPPNLGILNAWNGYEDHQVRSVKVRKKRSRTLAPPGTHARSSGQESSSSDDSEFMPPSRTASPEPIHAGTAPSPESFIAYEELRPPRDIPRVQVQPPGHHFVPIGDNSRERLVGLVEKDSSATEDPASTATESSAGWKIVQVPPRSATPGKLTGTEDAKPSRPKPTRSVSKHISYENAIEPRRKRH